MHTVNRTTKDLMDLSPAEQRCDGAKFLRFFSILTLQADPGKGRTVPVMENRRACFVKRTEQPKSRLSKTLRVSFEAVVEKNSERSKKRMKDESRPGLPLASPVSRKRSFRPACGSQVAEFGNYLPVLRDS